MEINQQLANDILVTAQESEFGCNQPETKFDLSQFRPQDSTSLAMMLVGAFHEKYDLVAILKGTIDVISETYEQEIEDLKKELNARRN